MRMIKVVPLPCPTYLYIPHPHKIEASSSSTQKSRRAFSLSALTISLSALVFSNGNGPTTSISWANPQVPKFLELPNSGGVKALDLRIGDGETPIDGDLVISGIETAVRSMKVGGLRRVIIPPSQGYQNTSQEPLPPNYFDRQRLFTTIFNPTRLANGEGATLGTVIFDIELVSLRHL
ncbi:peptidyl-prolyl cis-trans isomerase FKBP17-1, chloroplastic isoform X2 [Solanum tuberosum]|uniref:peptidyl-prolyl cis-trans isomerase FKBP17-1, chloroplastic isoform X2 n=1 Tax=Solanum tuberosum TaxID=4113 RepID=UPI00073A2012|nr:PREDICTED: peptidyl-prolyl cis-trans isomerase FKBP17-1, chloroplastic isoform X2 [Solanum tuberosum]